MNSSPNHIYAVFGSAAIIALAAYVTSSGRITDHDIFVMAEVAQQVAAGKSLYIEAWDNKPPLALLFYLPSQLISPHNYLTAQIFTFLWTLCQALTVFCLLRGEKNWLRLTITIFVLWMPLSRPDFIWGSSEDAVNGFTILLAVIGYRIFRGENISAKLWIICGLAAGLAFHARQPGVLFLAFPMLALLLSDISFKDKYRAFFSMLLGCVAAFALVISLMLIFSDGAAYIEAMFNKPLQYSGVKSNAENSVIENSIVTENDVEAPSQLMQFLAMIASKMHIIRSVLLAHFSMLGMDMLFVIPVLAIFAAVDWRQRLTIATLLFCGLGAVLLPMKIFSHYHQQLIPAFAIGSLFLLRRLDTAAPQLAKPLAAGMLLLLLLKVGITAESLRFDDGEQAEMNRVVEIMEMESTENQRIFAVGQNSAYIYFRSRLEPVHKIHWELFFGWLAIYLPENIESVMDTIVAQPPTWIAIDKNAREKFLLRPNLELEGNVRTGALLHRLQQNHVYQLTHTVGRWSVLRRKR